MALYNIPQGLISTAQAELLGQGQRAAGSTAVKTYANLANNQTLTLLENVAGVPTLITFEIEKVASGWTPTGGSVVPLDLTDATDSATAWAKLCVLLNARPNAAYTFTVSGSGFTFVAKQAGSAWNSLATGTAILWSVFQEIGYDSYSGALAYNKPSGSVNLLITDGDSISAQYGGDPRGQWQVQALSTLSGTWDVINVAVNGHGIRERNEAARLVVDPLISKRAARSVVVVWAGTNDPTSNDDANVYSVYSILRNYCRDRKNAGAFVCVVTMASRQMYTVGGVLIDWENWGARYNALIRKGFADGTLPCDCVADIALDSNLGGRGAYLNTTYFPDQIHLNRADAGAALAGQIIASAINGALSLDSSAPSNVALNRPYTTSPAPNASFPDSGGTQLTDGAVRGETAGDIEASVGWASDAVVRIDLGSIRNVCRVRDYHGGGGLGDIRSPSRVKIEVSTDDVSYTMVSDVTYGADAGEGWNSAYFQAPLCRYVKVSFFRQPDSWLMLGEVEVYGY